MTRPTEAEFSALAAARDSRLEALIRSVAVELGVDPDNACVHADWGGATPTCYCGCPDGPCQHDWTGPQIDTDYGFERTCARCGKGTMAHGMRVLP